MLFPISGRPFSGKSTLRRRLEESLPGVVSFPSHSTRSERLIEVSSDNYHFHTDTEFDEMVQAGLFCWVARPYQSKPDRYATLRSDVDAALAKSEAIYLPILEIENGTLKLLAHAQVQNKPLVRPIHLVISDERELSRRSLTRSDPSFTGQRIVDSRHWDGLASGHGFFLIDATQPEEAVFEIARQYILQEQRSLHAS